MDQYKISVINLGKNEFICYKFFEVWFLSFSLKEETMKNIHNQNMAELTHCIRVFLRQELGICFFDKKILVWHLFSLGFLMPKLHHLI